MNKSRRNKTLLRLVMDAMFIALYVVLSFFLSVRIPPLIKISWASLPLLIAALLFRPADAIAVALCGSFLEQLLSYGVGPTTPIWMAPPLFHALFVSLLAPQGQPPCAPNGADCRFRIFPYLYQHSRPVSGCGGCRVFPGGNHGGASHKAAQRRYPRGALCGAGADPSHSADQTVPTGGACRP